MVSKRQLARRLLGAARRVDHSPVVVTLQQLDRDGRVATTTQLCIRRGDKQTAVLNALVVDGVDMVRSEKVHVVVGVR